MIVVIIEVAATYIAGEEKTLWLLVFITVFIAHNIAKKFVNKLLAMWELKNGPQSGKFLYPKHFPFCFPDFPSNKTLPAI